MGALEARTGEVGPGGHARAVGTGNRSRAIGRAADDALGRRLTGKGVGHADD